MGKLKEISSFKRREIARELGKEGPNNYAIMFKGKKTFWKVVRSKRLADKIVSTLKSQGKDAKVVKARANREAEETKDVVEAVKEVAKQSKDVVTAVKGTPRKGRKPATKKPAAKK